MNTVNTNVHYGKLSLRTIVVFTFILFMTVVSTWRVTKSYYDTSETNDRVFLRLDSSLNNCNIFIQNHNRDEADEMENKLKDPTTVDKAKIWKPKLDSALFLSSTMYLFIQSIKTQMKENVYANDISSYLFDSLNNLNSNLLKLIPKEMRHQLPILPLQTLLNQKRQDWKTIYFKGDSRESTIAMLSKIESDVLLSTNTIIEYSNNQPVSNF